MGKNTHNVYQPGDLIGACCDGTEIVGVIDRVIEAECRYGKTKKIYVLQDGQYVPSNVAYWVPNQDQIESICVGFRTGRLQVLRHRHSFSVVEVAK